MHARPAASLRNGATRWEDQWPTADERRSGRAETDPIPREVHIASILHRFVGTGWSRGPIEPCDVELTRWSICLEPSTGLCMVEKASLCVAIDDHPCCAGAHTTDSNMSNALRDKLRSSGGEVGIHDWLL